MKKILVIMAVTTLMLMVVACGNNKKYGANSNGDGWQKIDDLEFSLSDNIFSINDSPWREKSERVRYINENRNNIFVEGKSLSKDYTWEKYVKDLSCQHICYTLRSIPIQLRLGS